MSHVNREKTSNRDILFNLLAIKCEFLVGLSWILYYSIMIPCKIIDDVINKPVESKNIFERRWIPPLAQVYGNLLVYSYKRK